ncbi:MAG: hypothetical protein GY878_31835 [Fuerstiella sp.]|nr:hypothetical protein [Fuerstiella sp.]
MRFLHCSVSATIVLSFMGCSGESRTEPVRGTVMFSDGKPLTEGTVEFELIGTQNPVTASGEIQADGSFELGTFAPQDGAIPGKHHVAVVSDYRIGTEQERPGLVPAPLLDPRYREFRTSGLEFEVKPGENVYNIQVEHAKKKKKKNGK